ncbi:MAG: hypothetical protein LUQ17_04205 [Methanomicrobiales archaeon]|nr:hypothetical protein [Methanomicrobiales archaeon]
MAGITEKRTVGEVKEILKAFLSDMGIEIIQEMERGYDWGFWVRFGNFPLLIQNQKDACYSVIVLHISVTDEASILRLNEMYDRNDAQAVFELTRAFTTPLTGFSRIVQRGKVTGFAVTKYIFPYHEGFSIEDFDAALQAVVSVGAVGVTYLKTIVHDMCLEHPAEA